MKSRVGGQRITLAKREARNGQSDDDSGRQLASLFTLESFDIDAFPTSLKKGEIRCRILCLNIEPALRAWLTTAAVAYADAVRVGDVIRSAGVALVTESRCPKFRAGDHVYGLVGWQSHAIFQVASHGQHLILCDTRIQRQVQNYEEALAVWSSILSHTGLTAYLGLVDFGRIQRGHRVLITNAAGGVGTIAVQIAKLKGAHVVATAGSDAKIKWLKDVLGVDVALDYRTVSNPDLRRAFNPGLDIILDNAGGRVLDQALLALSPGARVALSGFMTAYKSTEPRGLTNMYRVIETGSTVQGLLVTGEIMESHTKAKEDLYEWFRQGALRPIVNVRRGLEQCPLCFQSLFESGRESVGKSIVLLDDASDSLPGHPAPWSAASPINKRPARDGVQDGVQETVITNSRGRSIHLLTRMIPSIASRGGRQTIVLFIHGTGLPKELWLHVINRLSENVVATPNAQGQNDVACVCFDMSRMGESDRLNRQDGRSIEEGRIHEIWQADIIDVVHDIASRSSETCDFILVGHSAGSSAVLESAIKLTDSNVKVLGVVAIDPTALAAASSPAASAEPRYVKALKSSTARRREDFSSADIARKAYKSMPLFRHWKDSQLEILIQFAFTRQADGSLQSKTSRETEMDVYENWSKAFPVLSDRFRAFPCPLLLISATQSDIFPHALACLAANQPSAVDVYLQTIDADHLVIGSHPDELADHIYHFMQKL